MAEQHQKSSARVVAVPADEDFVVAVNPDATSRTFQNQSEVEIRGLEIRNAADQAAGTQAGTVGFVLHAAASGSLAGGSVETSSRREYRFRSLGLAPANLYVFEDD